MLAAEPVADDSEVPVEAAVVDLAEAAWSAPVTGACDVDRSADAAGVGGKVPTEVALGVDPPAGDAEDVTEAADKTAMGSALGDWRLELAPRVDARS